MSSTVYKQSKANALLFYFQLCFHRVVKIGFQFIDCEGRIHFRHISLAHKRDFSTGIVALLHLIHLIFKTEDGKTHYIDRWDLIIAHPPCNYMSNAGACRMYQKKGQIDEARLAKAMEAKAFFLSFLNADCERIAVENPRPLTVVGLPKESQRIQPYQFGEPWSKLTYLWLKNLPELVHTEVLSQWKPFVPSGTGRKLGGDSYGAKQCAHNSKDRSKTFLGIAKAMAEQWGSLESEGVAFE